MRKKNDPNSGKMECFRRQKPFWSTNFEIYILLYLFSTILENLVAHVLEKNTKARFIWSKYEPHIRYNFHIQENRYEEKYDKRYEISEKYDEK